MASEQEIIPGLVSVIIPSYNHAMYISQAVNSVLQQTWSEVLFRDLELIVIDDGSQDNSLEILERLAILAGSQMRVIGQENQGAHAAINRGLEMAKGSILAILNSDDHFHLRRLEKLVPLLTDFDNSGDQIGSTGSTLPHLPHNTRSSSGLAGSYLTLIDEHDQKIGEKHGYADCPPWSLTYPERSFRAENDLHSALQAENYFSTTSNFVFTRQCFEKVGLFRPLRYTHDWDFALRVVECGLPIQLIPEPLVSYRLHSRNTIRENQAAMIFEICWILAVHLPRYFESSVFPIEPLGKRIDQLLNSIYTYQCDRVLNLMLLQNLHKNEQTALSLLSPENEVRLKYLAIIQDQLANQSNLNSIRKYSSASPDLPDRSLLYRVARKIYSFRKIFITR